MIKKIKLFKGKVFTDHRGMLKYNNDFNAEKIKRIYTIQNKNNDIYRGWIAHKIESRWMACIFGSFEIKILNSSDFDNPNLKSDHKDFILESNGLNIIYIPPGFYYSIRSTINNSILLVMSDYIHGKTNDIVKVPFK